MRHILTDRGQLPIEGHPNNCPYCHKSITPNFIQGHVRDDVLEIMLICPNQECDRGFLGYYEFERGEQCWYFNGEGTQGNIIGREFSESINEISQIFIIIYNQAYAAEQQNLREICGVGYRKALEFLIKDYAILNNPDEKEKIEKNFWDLVLLNMLMMLKLSQLQKEQYGLATMRHITYENGKGKIWKT